LPFFPDVVRNLKLPYILRRGGRPIRYAPTKSGGEPVANSVAEHLSGGTMMRLGKWATVVAGAVMVLNISSIAQEPVVEPVVEPVIEPVEQAAVDPVAKFLDINDAVPSRFFDADATAPHADDPNKLIIAFHSGMDWTTWKATDFRASTAAFSHMAAMDTISFRVVAPEGFYIAKITYTQGGRGSVVRLAKAAGGAHWVVGAFAAHLGLFGTNPTLTGEADLSGLAMTSVPVSITNALFTFAAPALGAATLEVTSAEVQVYLLPLTESE
jgi:hypothetical protein